MFPGWCQMFPEWCQLLDNVAEDERKFVKPKLADVLVKPEPPPAPPSTVRSRVVGCS
jgi:hypothetical protein